MSLNSKVIFIITPLTILSIFLKRNFESSSEFIYKIKFKKTGVTGQCTIPNININEKNLFKY